MYFPYSLAAWCLICLLCWALFGGTTKRMVNQNFPFSATTCAGVMLVFQPLDSLQSVTLQIYSGSVQSLPDNMLNNLLLTCRTSHRSDAPISRRIDSTLPLHSVVWSRRGLFSHNFAALPMGCLIRSSRFLQDPAQISSIDIAQQFLLALLAPARSLGACNTPCHHSFPLAGQLG